MRMSKKPIFYKQNDIYVIGSEKKVINTTDIEQIINALRIITDGQPVKAVIKLDQLETLTDPPAIAQIFIREQDWLRLVITHYERRFNISHYSLVIQAIDSLKRKNK